jgi:predicted ATP-grasp superfamily ATP-dependent carboligase
VVTSSRPSPREATRAIVLVGFAEALSAPEVVWSLVDDGFKVIAFARRGRLSPLRYSRHVICHEISAPEFNLQEAISDLRSLLVSLSAADNGSDLLLLPLDDKAIYLCSKVHLDGNWRLAGPVGDSATLALNKDQQVDAAQSAGFAVPKTIIVRSAADLYSSSFDLSFPLILKPAQCVPISQGRLYKCRNWICANQDELTSAITQWAERVPLLVQPFISGVGEGVFGLAAADGIRAWSAHRRLRMMNPQGSGSSACISQPVPAEIRRKAETFLNAIKWRGLFMIELLRDDLGNLWFVELNGRSWGSMALSRRQGLEYPSWQVRLALDEKSSVGTPPDSLPVGLVCRNVGRELMHMLFVLRGAKSTALTDWPSAWKTLAQVLHIRKGDTFYNWRRDDRKVFVADCYCAMRDNLWRTRI